MLLFVILLLDDEDRNIPSPLFVTLFCATKLCIESEKYMPSLQKEILFSIMVLLFDVSRLIPLPVFNRMELCVILLLEDETI